MKKTILLITALVGLTLSSCKKQDDTCNCGIVQSDAIEYDAAGDIYYTLTVKSDCSGVSKKVYVDYSAWLDTPVGSNTCITGAGDWMPLAPITETIHPTDKNI